MSDPYWAIKEIGKQAKGRKEAKRIFQAMTWTPTWKQEVAFFLAIVPPLSLIVAAAVLGGSYLRQEMLGDGWTGLPETAITVVGFYLWNLVIEYVTT